MAFRIKVMQAKIDITCVAITDDENDNVFPLVMDPIYINGSDFPQSLMVQWSRALHDFQENQRKQYEESKAATVVTEVSVDN